MTKERRVLMQAYALSDVVTVLSRRGTNTDTGFLGNQGRNSNLIAFIWGNKPIYITYNYTFIHCLTTLRETSVFLPGRRLRFCDIDLITPSSTSYDLLQNNIHHVIQIHLKQKPASKRYSRILF